MSNEYNIPGRNKAKDALAWTMLYGGTAAAQFAFCTVGVAAGLVDKHAAKQVTKICQKMGPALKRRTWKKYCETGSIIAMIDEFFKEV